MKKLIMGGCPRSGTTALCTLLSHDPGIFLSNEIGNFLWEDDKFPERLEEMLDRHYIEWLLQMKEIEKEDFLLKTSNDPRKFAESIHEEYGFPVVGDKLPGYVDHLRDIYHANREAYFLITLRGVQHFVTSSTNHWHNGERAAWAFETIKEAQQFWVNTNSKMLENLGKILPLKAKVMLIRYEDIGPDVDQVINRISNFMDYPINITNPRGGFEAPPRKLRQFDLSDQAKILMDILGYDR